MGMVLVWVCGLEGEDGMVYIMMGCHHMGGDGEVEDGDPHVDRVSPCCVSIACQRRLCVLRIV
jgi:hypothetical protein